MAPRAAFRPRRQFLLRAASMRCVSSRPSWFVSRRIATLFGQETDAATFIRDRFLAENPAELREVRQGRPNIIAVLAGGGNGPQLMFNGHTDTVPPGTMGDAFSPRIEDGMLTGRGSCDMKAGLAAQICAMLALKRSGVSLSGDVIFTGVIAEEDGTSLGSLDIVANGPRADMVVVAEPTNLRVAISHKGFDYYRIEFEGRAAHSSRPEEGINAIYRAAAAIAAIREKLVADLAATTHPLLGPASVNVASIIGFPRSEIATALGRKGPIEKPDGGTVPDTCTVSLDHRRLPGMSHLDFVARLEALVAAIAEPGEAQPAKSASYRPVRSLTRIRRSKPIPSTPWSAIAWRSPPPRPEIPLRLSASPTGPMPPSSTTAGRCPPSSSVLGTSPSRIPTSNAWRSTSFSRPRVSMRCSPQPCSAR